MKQHWAILHMPREKKEKEGRSVKIWTNIKKKATKPRDAVFILRSCKTSCFLSTKPVHKVC